MKTTRITTCVRSAAATTAPATVDPTIAWAHRYLREPARTADKRRYQGYVAQLLADLEAGR